MDLLHPKSATTPLKERSQFPPTPSSLQSTDEDSDSSAFSPESRVPGSPHEALSTDSALAPMETTATFDFSATANALPDELNELNTFISEFAGVQDFAGGSDQLFLFDVEQDDEMRVDGKGMVTPSTAFTYSDLYPTAATVPVVLFPPAAPQTNFMPTTSIIYPNFPSAPTAAPIPSVQPPVASPIRPVPLPAAPAPNHSVAEVVAGALTITEEPAQFGRFRYKSEKREKSLEGEKTFPEVMINPSILKAITSGAITVSVVTRNGQPHWHELAGTIKAQVNPRQCRYKFNNLSVLMDKGGNNDVRRNKDDQRAVRLRFDLVWNAEGKSYISSVISRPIFNAKLQINKVCMLQGPVTGMQENIILCSKIRKTTTAIRIRDVLPHTATESPHSPPQGNGPAIKQPPLLNVWDRMPDHPDGKHIFIGANDLGFHHQYAIIVNMPPYHNLDITEPTRVEVQIVDYEDNTESQPVEYTYLPQEGILRRERAEQKKRRLQNDSNDFFGPGGGNGFIGGGGNGGGPQQPFNGGSNEGSGNNNNSSSSSGGNLYRGPGGHQFALGPVDPRVLQLFCATGDLKLLIKSFGRARITPDSDGDTPLHLAIENEQYSTAMTLIDLLTDDDLNEYNDQLETPLHLAVAANQEELIKKLIRYGARLDLSDGKGRTPLYLAAELGYNRALSALTSFQPDFYTPPLPRTLALTASTGLTPLHVVALRNDVSMAMVLLRCGVDPLAREKSSHRTAIHMAMQKGGASVALVRVLLEAVKEKSAEETVNDADFTGNTPLHYAVKAVRPDLITELRLKGADPHLLNHEGQSCFHLAISCIGHAERLRQILHALSASVKPKAAASPAAAAAAAAPSIFVKREEEEEWVIDDFDKVPSADELVHRDRTPFTQLTADAVDRVVNPSRLLKKDQQQSRSTSDGTGNGKDGKPLKGGSSSSSSSSSNADRRRHSEGSHKPGKELAREKSPVRKITESAMKAAKAIAGKEEKPVGKDLALKKEALKEVRDKSPSSPASPPPASLAICD